MIREVDSVDVCCVHRVNHATQRVRGLASNGAILYIPSRFGQRKKATASETEEPSHIGRANDHGNMACTDIAHDSSLVANDGNAADILQKELKK